jgi:rhodanese-related sulfurtransferase
MLGAGCERGAGAPARPPEASGAASEAAAPANAAEAGESAGRAPNAPRPVGESAGASSEQAIVRAPAADGDVLLIDVTEVRAKMTANAPLLLIDARGRSEYELEHLPGAVNVPLPKIATAGKLPGVPRDYEIVVYCSAEACPLSREAVRALVSFGYTNVKDMRAGLIGWKQAGFETARGKESG